MLIVPPLTLEERYGYLKSVGTLYPPLGLAYTAAIGERCGHEVKVVDAEAMGYSYNNIEKLIKDFNPDVVGMQSFCTTLERSYKVADSLKKKFKASIVLIGSFNDQQQINSLLRCMETKPFNLVGKTTVGQLCALIKNLDLLISIDTSSIHIAAAMNTPTIGLYGPTYPIGWTPWNKKNQVCLTHYHQCKKCDGSVDFNKLIPRLICTEQNVCLTTIQPLEVMNMASILLSTKIKK